jgi:hypothetical protein
MLGDVAVGHARAMNNHGQVIFSRSFLLNLETGVRDVHEFVPPIGRWYALELNVRAFSDAGQMVGAASFPEGRHAFLMTPIDADFDHDGDVDLDDFAAFQGCMTGPYTRRAPECSTYDINRDGHIDTVDLRVFQWVFAGG